MFSALDNVTVRYINSHLPYHTTALFGENWNDHLHSLCTSIINRLCRHLHCALPLPVPLPSINCGPLRNLALRVVHRNIYEFVIVYR